MDPQLSTSRSDTALSPKKKRPRVSFSVTEKLMIRNTYKYVFEEQSKLLISTESPNINECVNKTAEILRIGKNAVYSILKEVKENEEFKSPEKPGPKNTYKDKLDDFTFSAIRQKVHGFFHNNEPPTIDKVLKAVNDDPDLPNFSWSTMRTILKHLHFKYVSKKRKSIFIDKPDIVLWRHRYLQQIEEYRREGREIYYQDETWVNAGHTHKKAWVDETVKSNRQAFLEGLSTGLKNSSGKGKRLIISHIGGEDGFVDGGQMIFEAKTGKEDYHQEMNAECFEEWFGGVLPKLKPNSVVVMDNAPYHSRKLETPPKMSWSKARIREWLQDKGIEFDNKMIKATLIELAKRHENFYQEKFAVDEMAATHGVTVLRFPPYHCELNPIELVWGQVKGYVATNNKTYKINDVKILFEEGLRNVTPEKWKNCVTHVKKEELKMRQLDDHIDTVSDRFLINVTDDDDDDSSDSE